ncbi:STAS/SEC14 domain-containing protein [Hymenobacter sp. RP-2-7]|uniref:STAS/SEC14 domain-containing protein n=1 Tax=Hymenobacter polaris TaxID=2682546 RepID=A0A7Y0ABK2_9BACT|nr:STAS/SEC14 domain-containing protein [Hymenobacter polaris]NML64341.1 STAS/SEC14 domain-containing protein [Hymenobacter polaris]
MHLHLLCCVPQVSIYHDTWNDWLYIEWEGEITLPVAQRACAELARCTLTRPYARVLNNNTSLTGVGLEVGAWLAFHFMPHLPLAGVRHMAWVCSPELAGLTLIKTVMNWLPRLEATIFTDVEDAVSWLIQRRDSLHQPAARTPAAQAKLQDVLAALERAASVHAA